MRAPPKPDNEKIRLEALQSFQILDSNPEQEYDDIALVASVLCQTPIALISLVDKDRQWFKANVGLNVKETPRDISFCAYAILGEDIFTVKDSHLDERFEGNPLLEVPGVRFYAGAPIRTDDGHSLGTICVIDNEARDLTPEQGAGLQALSRLTMRLINTRTGSIT
jgi:GAF domain-containing protein